MPKGLVPLTVEAPGFYGLNTQQAGSILPPGWATELTNAVFDEIGRYACRNGSQHVNASAISGSPSVEAAHEFIDTDGTRVTIYAADNKIFKEVSGVLTDISGSITTPTANNWQFVNFNGRCHGFQAGHTPLKLDSAVSTCTDATGTQYNGNMALAAYGRIWTVVGNTLHYTDLLSFDFASGGTFDLAKYWPNGTDTVEAIADFNGFLVVFGQESIIIYRGAEDVSTMSIVEGIGGIGCIARDSVQLIGKDLVFLSSTGIRSLGRTIKDESMPLTDISKNVRTDLLLDVGLCDSTSIRSVYHKVDGFYLLSLPEAGLSYLFDLKMPLPDQSWRVTTWDIAPSAMVYTEDLQLYIALYDGYVDKYTEYTDGALSDGTGGSSFVVDFEGVWNDFGEDHSSYLKVLKEVNVLGSGTVGGSVIFKWAVDYQTTFHNTPLSFNLTPPAQYGIAQYGIDTYASTGDFERVRGPISKTGRVIKVGLRVVIDGNRFALQRVNVLAKIGRIGL